MPIFSYKYHGNPQLDGYNPHPGGNNCAYCKEKLEAIDVKDDWDITDNDLLSVHKETKLEFKKIHDLEDYYLDLDLKRKSHETWLNYCPKCGWWRLVEDVTICAKNGRYGIFSGDVQRC